eukprot:6129281-Prymnesium_polylepis.1
MSYSLYSDKTPKRSFQKDGCELRSAGVGPCALGASALPQTLWHTGQPGRLTAWSSDRNVLDRPRRVAPRIRKSGTPARGRDQNVHFLVGVRAHDVIRRLVGELLHALHLGERRRHARLPAVRERVEAAEAGLLVALDLGDRALEALHERVPVRRALGRGRPLQPLQGGGARCVVRTLVEHGREEQRRDGAERPVMVPGRRGATRTALVRARSRMYGRAGGSDRAAALWRPPTVCAIAQATVRLASAWRRCGPHERVLGGAPERGGERGTEEGAEHVGRPDDEEDGGWQPLRRWERRREALVERLRQPLERAGEKGRVGADAWARRDHVLTAHGEGGKGADERVDPARVIIRR